jgi:hypothetical protein
LKKTSIHVLLALALLAIVGAFSVQAAFADRPEDDTRPGWGFGDDNHEHTGPPGQSVHPVK